ncbi:MAG: adenylyl-sulfate kinase [Rhizobiales bacterium TMED249]|uniref:Multifunctional fusion protein n=1 Tax=PS1 clade bacterium TaxID=2175152 RepID=A0A368DUX2_9PROT|nr:MAG: adenylyl-sulfate kinase [Rhizobiales bacterium TMED249]RCL75642.1 MAG: sulfate adenylyltransferase subunit CysN [PS1 clade bacterium]HAK97705.1 adenylyl-sulfate kinase [Rhodobiaceae bacterium]|tara:strand:- start:4935 stop:6836 length:1902 start_codon:yes stop_codon:yes gene_type:complete
MHQSDLISSDIDAYLKAHENKSLLRFITCGSVDDGKSTLIGRLLYESKMIFEDQLTALEQDSKKVGTQGENIDFALLVDGLAAEREQGITIDVAYRFFATEHRKFIVADTPGHEQYTRNMATGASTADLAVLLIDARQGVLTQTKRHAFIASQLGVRHIVLAVNKMDLVDYSEKVFNEIDDDFKTFADQLDIPNLHAIPVSALAGDNVVDGSRYMPWYEGPSLLGYLEGVDVEAEETSLPFRMPVQWVNRPDLDFRGYAGRIAGGIVRPGDDVRVLPSGKQSKIARIVTMDSDLDEAVSGQSVTLTLTDEIDISRGDVIATSETPPEISDQFDTTIIWLSEEPMLPGRSYRMKTSSRLVSATVNAPKHKTDVNTLQKLPAKTLQLNEIGNCTLAVDRPIAFDSYNENRQTGSFILIDRMTNNTVGMGMINFPLRRAANIHWQNLDINKAANAEQKGQSPAVLWFTGLSGSGKSTIANEVQRRLFASGRHSFILDGDNVRHGLNRDLGFTDADRVENIRRVAEVSKLMVDAGLITLVSFISPFRAERELARNLMEEGEFIEIFVNTPLSVAETRDPKGLYKKARAGNLKNFTGIDSPYEAPENPEIEINTDDMSVEDAAERVIKGLIERGIIEA